MFSFPIIGLILDETNVVYYYNFNFRFYINFFLIWLERKLLSHESATTSKHYGNTIVLSI